jgi:hypothetical protein
MAIMTKAGWTRDDVARFCLEHTQISLRRIEAHQAQGRRADAEDETRMMSLVQTARRIFWSSPQADARACSQRTFPAGAVKQVRQSVTKEIRQR